jgi:hypothetical protein
MTMKQKLTWLSASLALAFAVTSITSAAPASADEQGAAPKDNPEASAEGDPSVAPVVLDIVDGGVQTAAGATEGGLGIGAAASGEPGVGIGAAGTDVGAQAAGAGLGIPGSILSQP